MLAFVLLYENFKRFILKNHPLDNFFWRLIGSWHLAWTTSSAIAVIGRWRYVGDPIFIKWTTNLPNLLL